jgi:hypothetical protein
MKDESINLDAFQVGETYTKVEVAFEGEVHPPSNSRTPGISQYANAVLLFVTLEKEETYRDTFDGTLFQWQSQHRQGQHSPVIQAIGENHLPVLLFARLRAKDKKGKTLPFVYCGNLLCLGMQGEFPVTVKFQSLSFDPGTSSPLLRQIYEWRSDKPAPDVDVERRDEIEAQISTGQGRLIDAKLRKAIELHGMKIAIAHYEGLKYEIKDTSRNHPYDLECSRGSELRRVEVKATQGDASEVYVTSGEVRGARDPKFITDLFVVYGVCVLKAGDAPIVSGGQEHIVKEWRPKEDDLVPTQYRCKVPL